MLVQSLLVSAKTLKFESSALRDLLKQLLQYSAAMNYLFKFKLCILRSRKATTNIQQIHVETNFSLESRKLR